MTNVVLEEAAGDAATGEHGIDLDWGDGIDIGTVGDGIGGIGPGFG